MRAVYRFLFRVFGWKIVGGFPPELKKYIVAVAPHTSNIDFLIGVACRSLLKMQNARFLAKRSLFRPPFGFIFRWLGGYPVDRHKSGDMVGQVAAIFAREDHFILAIAPEGTRKKVEKLRTGFYYIARQAGVPIIPCGFDYSKKEVIIGSAFYPSQDVTADIDLLTTFFKNIRGKNPALGIGFPST
jgi:1-acyl-sn-glycerol-3-phosphate acyltransferase